MEDIRAWVLKRKFGFRFSLDSVIFTEVNINIKKDFPQGPLRNEPDFKLGSISLEDMY